MPSECTSKPECPTQLPKPKHALVCPPLFPQVNCREVLQPFVRIGGGHVCTHPQRYLQTGIVSTATLT